MSASVGADEPIIVKISWNMYFKPKQTSKNIFYKKLNPNFSDTEVLPKKGCCVYNHFYNKAVWLWSGEILSKSGLKMQANPI